MEGAIIMKKLVLVIVRGIIMMTCCLIFVSSVYAYSLIPVNSNKDSGYVNAGFIGYSIIIDKEQNIIVAGAIPRGLTSNYLIEKYRNNFDVIVSTEFNGPAGGGTGLGGDIIYGAAIDPEGNIIVTGTSQNIDYYYDYLTFKYTGDLKVMLSSSVYDGGTKLNAEARGVIVDSDGNIFVTGTIGSDFYESIIGDCLTIKYDKNLNPLASHKYRQGQGSRALDIAKDSKGNIFVTGYIDTDFSQNVNYNIFVLKYDKNLKLLASTTYDAGVYERPYALMIDKDDNVIVGGGDSDKVSGKLFLIKYDNNLTNILASAASNYAGGAKKVEMDFQGNILAIGEYQQKFFLMRYDPYLVFLSSASIDMYYARDLTFDNEGNILITGRVGSNSSTVRYLGPPIISSVFPSSGKPGETIIITVNGKRFYDKATLFFSGSGVNIGLVGSIDSGISDKIKLAITISDDAQPGKRNLTITNTDGASGILSEGFEVLGKEGSTTPNLTAIYNNIIKPSENKPALIRCNLKEDGKLMLKIYDSKGNEVVVLFEGTKSAGRHDFEWYGKDAGGDTVGSGVYIVYVQAGSKKETKKIVVVK